MMKVDVEVSEAVVSEHLRSCIEVAVREAAGEHVTQVQAATLSFRPGPRPSAWTAAVRVVGEGAVFTFEVRASSIHDAALAAARHVGELVAARGRLKASPASGLARAS